MQIQVIFKPQVFMFSSTDTELPCKVCFLHSWNSSASRNLKTWSNMGKAITYYHSLDPYDAQVSQNI